MDVHYKGELVVTVCAIVHTSGEGMESRIKLIKLVGHHVKEQSQHTESLPSTHT